MRFHFAGCAMFNLLRLIFALLALAIDAGAYGQTFNAIPPIAPGRYSVGCSNVAQDFSRVGPGDSAQAYWEGRGGGGTGYLTDLLVDPAHAFVTGVTLPDDRELYGDFRNRTLASVNLVCYPTSAANPYADYALPNGKIVPHMQRGAQPPIFAEDRARYPVLLFSHGFGGSPISSDYIEALKVFASHGYVVVAPFHGDSRIVDVRIDSLDELLRALLDFPNYTAMQAINDTRLRAGVGYVPYFGQPIFPAFGRDQRGLQGVDLPYLAISGSEDTTAPAEVTAIGMTQLPGVRQFVVLEGVRHGFDVAASDDIFTWSLTFLDAYVDDQPRARATSARMTRVQGGGDDVLLLDRAQPLPPASGEQWAIEYYNPSLDHYFMTSGPGEVAILDAGTPIVGWVRTGYIFKVYAPGTAAGTPACRFFGKAGVGPNTHFFSILPNECADVMASPLWTFEGLVFRVEGPNAAGECPADRVPVVRMYNNGKEGEANHRYLTSHSEIGAMLLQGWIVEGTVFLLVAVSTRCGSVPAASHANRTALPS